MGPACVQTGPALAGVAQLLDEHHLAVLADDQRRRRRFARDLADRLAGLSGARVTRVAGSRPVALQRLGRLDAWLARLRAPGRSRWHHVVWAEPDEMLEHDVGSFCRVVSAILAIAAAHEHLSPEPLTLLRLTLIGGPKLGALAEDDAGPLRRWMRREETPLVRAAARVVPRPPVLVCRLDG